MESARAVMFALRRRGKRNRILKRFYLLYLIRYIPGYKKRLLCKTEVQTQHVAGFSAE
jgi:hypothetical protein